MPYKSVSGGIGEGAIGGVGGRVGEGVGAGVAETTSSVEESGVGLGLCISRPLAIRGVFSATADFYYGVIHI